MRLVKLICDLCGATEETPNECNSQYATVAIGINRGNYYRNNEKHYLLCPKCQKEVGLIREGTDNLQPVESVADQLYDLINQIIQESTCQ
jgi:hypothetical protein